MNENIIDLEHALDLLREAKYYMENTHGDDQKLYYEIQEFLNQFY